MITSNFKNLIAGLMLNASPISGAGYSNYLIPLTDVTYRDTSNIPITWLNAATTTNQSAVQFTIKRLNTPVTDSSSQGTYVQVGTGTTAPTEDDYDLETLNTDIVCDSIISAFTSNKTKTYTATLSNPTANDIQVTEIGLFVVASICTDSSSSTSNRQILLDRTVLSTPISIPAGESKSITYEIVF